jgi:hypothetical protein
MFFNGDASDLIREGCRRSAASLIARLPILAISTADNRLPMAGRDNLTNTEHHYTTLEVKWGYVGGVIGFLIGAQLLAIFAVLYLCRNIFVRDDSYLSTARLFKTVLAKVKGGSLADGEELALGLDVESEKKRGIRFEVKYGTKLTADGKRIVDLADDVEDGFLPGPYEGTPKAWQRSKSRFRKSGR